MSKQAEQFQTSELVGGPQDGARVTIGCRPGHDVLPQTIYVGPKNLGDAYAAWSRERCARFPVCYVLDGYKHKFRSESK